MDATKTGLNKTQIMYRLHPAHNAAIVATWGDNPPESKTSINYYDGYIHTLYDNLSISTDWTEPGHATTLITFFCNKPPIYLDHDPDGSIRPYGWDCID